MGAGLPAVVGVRACLLTSTIRQQAGSYKGARCFAFVGAGLPAILGVRTCLLTGTIRQQAGSYKRAQVFCICRSWPAGDSQREGMAVDRHDSPAGWLLQGAPGVLHLWELACRRLWACNGPHSVCQACAASTITLSA